MKKQTNASLLTRTPAISAMWWKAANSVDRKNKLNETSHLYHPVQPVYCPLSGPYSGTTMRYGNNQNDVQELSKLSRCHWNFPHLKTREKDQHFQYRHQLTICRWSWLKGGAHVRIEEKLTKDNQIDSWLPFFIYSFRCSLFNAWTFCGN